MERRVSVIYPDASEIDPDQVDDQDIPVLIFVDGKFWQKRTNIERLLRHTNLIVVMPSTDLAHIPTLLTDRLWCFGEWVARRFFTSLFFPNMIANVRKFHLLAYRWAVMAHIKSLKTNDFLMPLFRCSVYLKRRNEKRTKTRQPSCHGRRWS